MTINVICMSYVKDNVVKSHDFDSKNSTLKLFIDIIIRQER